MHKTLFEIQTIDDGLLIWQLNFCNSSHCSILLSLEQNVLDQQKQMRWLILKNENHKHRAQTLSRDRRRLDQNSIICFSIFIEWHDDIRRRETGESRVVSDTGRSSIRIMQANGWGNRVIKSIMAFLSYYSTDGTGKEGVVTDFPVLLVGVIHLKLNSTRTTPYKRTPPISQEGCLALMHQFQIREYNTIHIVHAECGQSILTLHLMFILLL